MPEPTSGLDVAGVCYRPLAAPAFIDLIAAYRHPGPDPLVANVVRVLRGMV